jgi:glycosyltransferase involved in cell wall biosynthesis
MKLVSVIIPCYRQAHFLGEAIESILSQTYPNFEIIVVDDGSPDNVHQVANRYSNVRYIGQENQGRSAARNAGLLESKGSYLVFLDADDRLLPNALKTGVKYLDIYPKCALVYGHIRLIQANGSILPTPEQERIERDHYCRLLHYNYICTTAKVMFRRTVFDSDISFDPSLTTAEDWDLYLRISRKFSIYGHGKVIAEHRLHEGNITRNYALMLKLSLRVLRSQLDFIKGSKHSEEAYKLGVKCAKEYYGDPLVSNVKNHLRRSEWGKAMREMLVLLKYNPSGFKKLFS